jgi:hypothetical protein
MTRDEVSALLGEPSYSAGSDGRYRWTFDLPRDDRFLAGVEPYYVDFGDDHRALAFGIDKDESERRAAIHEGNVSTSRDR